MANMFLKLSTSFKSHWERPLFRLMAFLMLGAFATAANAQNMDGLCAIAGFFKSGIGIIAVIAILGGIVLAMFSKMGGLMEVLILVLICMAVAAFAPNLAAKAGFAVSCSGL